MNRVYEPDITSKRIVANKRISTTDDPVHWHEGIEIICFLGGEGKVLNGNETYSAKTGEIYVVNSETVHSVLCASTSGEYVYIIPKPYFCEENGFPTNETFFEKRFFDERIYKIIKEIAIEREKKDKYHEQSISIKVLEILLLLHRDHLGQNYTEQANSAKTKLVKKTIKFIRKNLQDPITIEDIEKNCGYSKFYISRIFKEITGKTVMTFLNEVRIDSAKKLLISENASVFSVSSSCGFTSQSYFGKVFKKHTGLTPLEYKSKFSQ